MQPQEVGEFFAEIKNALDNNWSDEALKSLAKYTVPDVIAGNHGWLLRGDLSTVWGRWFIESLVDLAPFELDPALTIGHLHVPILAHVNAVSPQVPMDERKEYARILTRFAWQLVSARRSRRRSAIGAALREELWALGQPAPRCYLCGFEFGGEARDRFLGISKSSPPETLLVDFTRPRGVRSAQLCIEVDHVVPVAEGGETGVGNLRLACGWCNSVKNRYTNIYDVIPWSVGIFEHPALGPITQPQPLWILRTVATRRRCEAPEGCTLRIEETELFAGPRNQRGALTPVNVAVYCEQHDPWRLDRWVGPKRLASVVAE
ncbi:HNH endonuclease signature motif containing protein [Streptomyces sp. NPDC047043]|uniref:HNH endonuclease n=1 Tax=Streptomyces sp. NPDC047043 TaxID=3154497 RepID=UPI0033C4BE4F